MRDIVNVPRHSKHSYEYNECLAQSTNVVIHMRRSRDISADMAGISFIILFATGLFTPLSTLFIIFTPVPLAFLFFRGLLRRAIAVLLATLIAFSWIGSLPFLVFVVALIGVYAFVLGNGFRKWKLDVMAVIASLVIVLSFLLGIAAMQAAGEPLTTLIHKTLLTAFHATGQIRIVADGSTNQIIRQIMQQVNTYLPGLIVIVSTVITLVDMAVLSFLFQRMQQTHVHVMRNIRFPKYIGGVYVLILLAQLLSAGGNTILVQFIGSAWMIISFLLVVQALSVIWWKLSNYAPGPFLAVVSVLGSLVPVIGYLYVLMGLLDTIFDFRGRSGTKSR